MKPVQFGNPRVRASIGRYLGRGLLFGAGAGCGAVTAGVVFALLFGIELFSAQANSLHILMLGIFTGHSIAGLSIGLIVGLRCAGRERAPDR